MYTKDLYEKSEELRKNLDEWLHDYNHERPHRGYWNMGRRTIETGEESKVIKEQMARKADLIIFKGGFLHIR